MEIILLGFEYFHKERFKLIRESCTFIYFSGLWIWKTTWECSFAIFIEIKEGEFYYDPSFLILSIYPRETQLHKQMFLQILLEQKNGNKNNLQVY